MNTSIANNRSSEEYARKVFEKLFRNEAVRTTCARLLADSIFFAHSISPYCWTLTLSSNRIRFNVGPVEVLVFRSSDIFLVIADSEDGRFSNLEYHNYIKPSALHYPSVPIHQCLCNIPPESIEKTYPRISENHRRFIQSAANCKKVTSWKSSFSIGLILYLQSLLKVTLPTPAYYAPSLVQNQQLFPNPIETEMRDTHLEESESNRPTEAKEAIFQRQWDGELSNWIGSSRNIEKNLAKSFIRFFTLVFGNTSCQERAWFGIHTSRASLVVGGIFLAAIIKSGKDKGVWLLLKNPPVIDGWQSWDTRSTQAGPDPIKWFHTSHFEQVVDILDNPLIWESYRIASIQILDFAIASDRNSVQESRGKFLLSKIYTPSNDPLEETGKYRSSYENLQGTDRQAVIQSRIGQEKFRDALIRYWHNKCAVTGCRRVELLRASHIKPWSEASDEERLDKYNGLLLVPNLDVAFDAGYISFSDDGRIMISRYLTEDDQNRLGIHPDLSIDGLTKRHAEYLQYHRELKFKG